VVNGDPRQRRFVRSRGTNIAFALPGINKFGANPFNLELE